MTRPIWWVSRTPSDFSGTCERHAFDDEASADEWATTDQGKYRTIVFAGWVED